MLKQKKGGRIGINTSNPQSTLEITPNTANSDANATTNEGLIIPKLTTARVKAITPDERVEGTMVYITDEPSDVSLFNSNTKGFYYWDSNKWIKVGTEGAFTRNIRSDNRMTVVVDQLENGTTATNDYFIVLTNPIDPPVGSTTKSTNDAKEVAITIEMPIPSDSNIGRTICFFNRTHVKAVFLDDREKYMTGAQNEFIPNVSACYISDGKLWYNYNTVNW